MTRWRPFIYSFCLFALAGKTHATSDLKPMTEEERSSVIYAESILIPVPGEFFAALDKQGKRNWPSLMRNVPSPASPNRAQMALNLGTLIADGYIAVEAQDGQQVKNIGRDILAIAKTLGVSQDVLNRGQSITDFAENNDWSGLKEELEATQNEVKMTMTKQKDQDLITLVNLGSWIRGMQAASTLINQDYTPEAARLLYQPSVANHLLKKVDLLTPRLKEDPLVQQAQETLAFTREEMCIENGDSLSHEAIHAIENKTFEIINKISDTSASPPSQKPSPKATP